MANLKEIRNRISSVSSTMQITSAMKMVSAAKLKKATDAISQMRPYSDKLTELIQNLSSSFESGDRDNPYVKIRPVNKILVVAITSNRGLCGGFNSNIIKAVNEIYKKNPEKKIDILSIGKKSSEHFTKNGFNVASTHDALFGDLTFENVSIVAEGIMEQFVDGDYDKVVLVYNQFKNAATQIPQVEQFLPIKPIEGGDANAVNSDYIFDPSKEEIVLALIPKSLKTQLYKALRDSFASEHGARMTAMHKATDNAGDMLFDLKLTYNKARQASITNEILEIVGGAEALKN